MIRLWLKTVVVLLSAPLLAADDPVPDYEQVLIPVNFAQTITRSNGAVWSVTNVARNEHHSPVAIIQGYSTCHIGGCDLSTPPGGERQLTAGPAVPAGMVNVAAVVAHRIHFSSRLVNSADPTATLELPVVRERNFRHEEFSLMRIPVDRNSKVDVRVYDPRATSVTTVRVTVRSETDSRLLAQFDADIVPVVQEDEDFPLHPGYFYLGDLAARYPDVRTSESVRVSFEPLTEGMEFWAMVSVTDNLTNRISLFTPQ